MLKCLTTTQEEALDVARGSTGQRVAIDRMTISLIPRTAKELEQLHEKTGLSKTDIMNRAISLYAFVTEQMDSGKDLVIRDPQMGEQQLIQLF
jgi:hypothetical protein